MYETIELTTAGFGGGWLSLLSLFLFLAVGAILQNDDSENEEDESFMLDPDFLPSVKSHLEDILRYVSRRPSSGDQEEEKEDGPARDALLDEVESFFNDVDEDDELFASDDVEFDDDDETSGKDAEDAGGRSNFTGAFFKNRDYPRDVYDSDGEERKKSDSEPSRWSRPKDDASEGANDDSEDENYDSFDSFDEDDDDFLDNDDISVEEKIARLRERLNDGDESARLDLIELLVESVADAGADEQERVFSVLDEAQKLLDESDEHFDDEWDEAECHVAIQRAVFYVRNNLKAPFELVAAALQRVREWNQKSDSEASRSLLARAWLLHGQCLLATGSSVAALSSFQKARSFFESGESFSDDENSIPALGYALVSEADAYRSAGDVEKAIAAFREAVKVFGAYPSKRHLLSQKANVQCQLALTLRDVDRFKESSEVMGEAISSEERLFSYDPDKYFLALAQLLRIQADTSFKLNDVDAAFALLERAESILLSRLQEATPLKRRVDAYSQLIHVLRSRAEMNFMRRRLVPASRDTLGAFRYLSQAVEKDDDLNPGPAIVSLFAFAYDMSAMNGKWDELKEVHSLVRDIIGRLTARERRATELLYSDLLLHMHIINASQKHVSEALEMTNAAIETLEAGEGTDDPKDECRRSFLLAKALYQRGSAACIIRHDFDKALEDFDRIYMLFSESALLAEGENQRQIKEFYFEFLWRYSCVLWVKKDLRRSRAAISAVCRSVMFELETGTWWAVSLIKKIVRASLHFAEKDDDPLLFFRLTRFWLSYVRLVRRRFCEEGWNVADDEDASVRNARALSDLDEALQSVLVARVKYLGACSWKPEYERFIAERSSEQGQKRGDGEEEAQSSGFVPVELIQRREQFAKGTLSTKPNVYRQWLDLQKCVYAVERQIESGNVSRINFLAQTLKTLNELCVENGAPELAAVEDVIAARLVAGAAVKIDPEFHTPADILLKKSPGSTSSANAAAPTSVEEPVDDSDESDELEPFSDEDDEDEAFWVGAFRISQLYLVELERLFLQGKRPALSISDSVFPDADDDETEIWFRDVSGAEATDDELEEAALEARSGERASAGDYAALTGTLMEKIDNAMEIAELFGRKFISVQPAYFYVFANLIKHRYEWLVVSGRGEEAQRRVTELLASIEAEKTLVWKSGSLLMLSDFIAESALKEPKDLAFARVMLNKNLEYLKTTQAAVLAPKSVWIATYLRLAFTARETNDKDDEAENFRNAAEVLTRENVQKPSYDDYFHDATNLLMRFFETGDPKDRRVARDLLRHVEATFDAGVDAYKKDCLNESESATKALVYSWFSFMHAAAYFDSERHCFQEAQRLYRKAEDIFVFVTEKAEAPLPFDVYAQQMDTIAFYERNSLVEDGARVVRAMTTLCERWLMKADGARLDDDSKGRFARLILQLNLLTGEYGIFHGDISLVPELLEKTLAGIRATSDFIGFTLEKRPRKGLLSRFRKNSAVEALPKSSPTFLFWGMNYYLGEAFAEFAKNADGEFSVLKRRVEDVLKNVRKRLGPSSMCEFTILYYWSDFSLRKGEWSTAIAAASALTKRVWVFEAPFDESGYEQNFKMMRLDALKIEALARLERGRFGDLARAEKALAAAFATCLQTIAEKGFQVRSIYTELLFVQAKACQKRGRYEEALAFARRALGRIERSEARGMTNWLPALRKEAGPLVEELEKVVDERRRNAPKSDN